MSLLFTLNKGFSQTSWKGTTSTNWAIASNWTAGVPLVTTDVIIGDANFTGAYQPAISATAAAKSLTIGGSVASNLTVASTLTVKGNVTINSNGTLTNGKASISLTGNWVNGGSYTTTSTSAKIIFNGTTQTLGGTVVTTFRKLTINTGSIVTLNSNFISTGSSGLVSISGTLNPSESPSYLVTADNLTVNNAGVLKVNTALFASNYVINTAFTLSAGSIVEYAATSINQTISSSYSYSTLRTSGSGIKSLVADLPALRSTSSSTGSIYVLSGTLNLSTYLANRGTTLAGGVLSIANGAFLKVAGANNFPANFTTNTLNLTSTVEYNGGNQAVVAKTYGNLTLSSASGAAVKTMPATAFTVAGNMTSSIGAGTSVSFAAASNISVTGSLTIGASTTFDGASFSHAITGNFINNGTFTPSTSVITLKGANTTISGNATQNFYTLAVTGSNISAASVTAINISGDFSTSGSGTFSHPAPATFTMTGTTRTLTGTGMSLDNLSVTGSVTTTSTATLTGNLSVTGSLVASSGMITMSGSSKTISNSGTLTFRDLLTSGTISTAASFTIGASLNNTGSFTASSGTITFTGSSLLSGTDNLFNVTINATSLTLAGNAVMGIAGAFVITAGSFNVTSNIPNTVNYNGSGAQTVKGTAYNNLIMSGGGTKTAGAAVTVNNTLTISASTTFDASTFTHTMVGNWINNGTFTAGTSTVQFTGATNASVSGATTFNIVTINKSLTTYTVSLLSNVSVSTINMTLGSLNTGTSTLTITTTRSGNGIILGTITRTHAFVAATAYAFEGPYNTIIFAAGVSGVTSVTVNITVAPVADFPYNGAVARTYTITVPSGTYNATLRLHYEDAELNGNDESLMQLWKYNGTAWAVSGKTANSISLNYVEKSGLTNITNRWSFTDDGNVLNWNGSVSSDWSNAANWTLVQGTSSGAPTSYDIAQIGVATFTNQPTITTAAMAKSINFGSAKAATLTLNSGGSLNVSGSVSGNWTSNAAHAINANNQNITINGDLILSDNTTNHTIALSTGTGIVVVTGAVVESGGANISFSGAGTLDIGKDFTYTSGTFTPGTGTVKYSGSTTQIVAAVPYNNLTIIKTAGTIASLTGTTALTGNLLVTSGEFDISTTLGISGSVTISAGAVLDGNAATLNVGGNWTKSGTFNAGNGTITMNGTGTQTLSACSFNTFTINKASGSVALSGNNTLTGNLSLVAGTVNLSTYTFNQSSSANTFSMADGTTLLVSGATNFPSNFITYNIGAASLVHYNGTVAQTVANLTYGNITFSNGVALEKTFAGSSTVNGNLTINSGASLNGANNIITLNGNWINNSGTFNAGTGDILLNGTNKTLTGNTVFNDVTVNGIYSVATSDMTFNGSFQVTAGGSYTAGTGVATVNGDLTNAGSLTSAGTTTFSGNTLQTIRLLNAIASTSTGIINFNGTVSPVLNSTSTPLFATLNINNTAGINPSVNWVVLVAFNVSSSAIFNGGPSTHTFSGSFTNNGTVTSSGTLNFNPSGTVTVQLSGSSFSSTGTVIFGGSGALTLTGTATALQDVIIANTNAAGITAPTAWTINDNFSINSNAIFNAGSFSHTVAGDIESNGTLNGNTSLFTMTAPDGSLSGSPATNFNNLTIAGTVTTQSDYNVTGNFLNNGTYDGSLGALIMTGSNAASIGGTTTPSPIALLTINKDSGVMVTENVNINTITALTINSGILFTSTYSIAQNAAGGIIVIAADATLKLGGTNTIPAFSGYGFDEASTVDYAGTTQTIANGPVYGNLTISAPGNKTAPSFLPLTVAGNLSITDGTFIANNNTHKVAGNWIMTGGTFNNTNSVIRFNGTADQSVQTIAAFNSINISKTSGVVTLSSNVTVNAILSFTTGKIQTGNNTVIIPSAGSVTGAGAASGWVYGNLQKNVATGVLVSRTFEVGDSAYYSPVTVSFATVSTAGDLKAKVTSPDHTEIDYSGIDSAKSVNRYWSLTNAGIAFTNASATFNWVAANIDVGATTANFKTASFNGTSWTLNSFASPLSTSIRATNLSSFGDFITGEGVSQYRWTGEAFTADWNTSKNWSGGVPTTAVNTLITSGINGGRFYPVLNTGTGIVKNITIQSAANLTVSAAKLQVTEAIANNGTFTANNGIIEMTGTAGQTIASNSFQNNAVKDLIISNSSVAGVQLGGQLDIYGTLSFTGTGKTFNTNDVLTLKSTSSNTASVGDLTGNFITGKVTVERYLPARKAWRFLSVPTNTTQTIKQTWQEGATATGSNPVPGYGIQITSNRSTWSADGFDLYSAGGASMKTYNAATNLWTGVSATNSGSIKATDGYMTFVRGDRTANAYNSTPTATVLRTKGTLYTYDQPSITVASGKFASIGNPYASMIDMRKITRAGIKDFFYVWDPNLGGTFGLGAYQTFSYNGSDFVVTPGSGSYGAAGSVSNYIESGMAFLVQATAAGGMVTLTETVKSGSSSRNVTAGSVTPVKELRTSLLGIATDSSTYMADGVMNSFSDAYSNDADDMDAIKSTNSSENLSIKTGGQLLVVERRHTVTDRDTIFLNLANTRSQRYRFAFDAHMDQPGLSGWLEDSYLNTRTALNLSGVTTSDFSIANIAGSYAPDRFRIVFETSVILPVTITSVKAWEKSADIAVEWKVENENNLERYEIEKSVDGNNFVKAGTVTATASKTYTWLDTHAVTGYNYYRIKCIDINAASKYSSVVKVAIKPALPVASINVYPNPITGNTISVLFANIEKGEYRLQLYNSAGQLVAMKTIIYDSTTAPLNFEISEGFAAGKYELKLTGNDVNLYIPVIKK